MGFSQNEHSQNQGRGLSTCCGQHVLLEGRTHPCPSWWLGAQPSDQTDAPSVPERKQNHPDLPEDIKRVLI